MGDCYRRVIKGLGQGLGYSLNCLEGVLKGDTRRDLRLI